MKILDKKQLLAVTGAEKYLLMTEEITFTGIANATCIEETYYQNKDNLAFFGDDNLVIDTVIANCIPRGITYNVSQDTKTINLKIMQR